MKKLALLAVLFAVPAQAQTYQTFRNYSGNGSWSSMTYAPNGAYQTFGNGGSSMTYGPDGYSAQTFYGPGGSSMTYVNPGYGDGE